MTSSSFDVKANLFGDSLGGRKRRRRNEYQGNFSQGNFKDEFLIFILFHFFQITLFISSNRLKTSKFRMDLLNALSLNDLVRILMAGSAVQILF